MIEQNKAWQLMPALLKYLTGIHSIDFVRNQYLMFKIKIQTLKNLQVIT